MSRTPRLKTLQPRVQMLGPDTRVRPLTTVRHSKLYNYRWQQARARFLEEHPLCMCRDCDEGRIRASVASSWITIHRTEATTRSSGINRRGERCQRFATTARQQGRTAVLEIRRGAKSLTRKDSRGVSYISDRPTFLERVGSYSHKIFPKRGNQQAARVIEQERVSAWTRPDHACDTGARPPGADKFASIKRPSRARTKADARFDRFSQLALKRRARLGPRYDSPAD